MVHDHKACLISTADFDTNIFDLDGVITDTASVHAQAWKQMFDDFLTRHAQRENVPFQPFVIETDYRSYVDGKPRIDGLKSFLNYYGTLAPIVDTPDNAVMQKDMRTAVIELSRHCTVGIISGRDLKDIQQMVQIDSIVYAGSHGYRVGG